MLAPELIVWMFREFTATYFSLKDIIWEKHLEEMRISMWSTVDDRSFKCAQEPSSNVWQGVWRIGILNLLVSFVLAIIPVCNGFTSVPFTSASYLKSDVIKTHHVCTYWFERIIDVCTYRV